MLQAFFNLWQFHFWYALACLAAGIAVVAPFLLSTSFRKWFFRIDVDLENIGLVVLVLAIVAIGLYNNYWR